MKTLIIGAGAMGGLFGAMLARAGGEICLLDRRREHIATIVRRGLTVEHGDDRPPWRVHLPAVTDPEAAGPADLVVVFVKSPQTPDAAAVAERVRGQPVVLTLQNGMGNAEILAATLDPLRVLAGTTAWGATLLGPGRIRLAGRGATQIGPWSENAQPAAARVAAHLRAAGIETTVAADPRPLLWSKLLVNVGINAVTALTGIRNGQLLDLPETRELCRAAVAEAAAVARAQGVAPATDPFTRVLEVAAATAANRSSMGQDIDAGRETEIAAINGFVVREAARLGLPAPVNQTLSALVVTRQHHGRPAVEANRDPTPSP